MNRDTKIAVAVAVILGAVLAWQLSREGGSESESEPSIIGGDDGIWLGDAWYPAGSHPLMDAARDLERELRSAGRTAGYVITGS